MQRIHVLVEGQTEQIIVRDVLDRACQPAICLQPVLLTTKRPAGGSHHHGGVSRWAKIEYDVRLLLRDSSARYVTTLLDYYGVPGDTPGMVTRPSGTPHERVEHVERAMAETIADPRFVPNLVLHEAETWVLAAAEQLGALRGDAKLAADLNELVDLAGGPEFVNDGVATAPSKRLRAACPTYNKTQDGPIAVSELGVDALRRVCPHFDRWLRRITS